MGEGASEDQLDKAFKQGTREGKAGGDFHKPYNHPLGDVFGRSQAKNEENNAYERGWDAGRKNRDK